jgi:hypothetical protein
MPTYVSPEGHVTFMMRASDLGRTLGELAAAVERLRSEHGGQALVSFGEPEDDPGCRVSRPATPEERAAWAAWTASARERAEAQAKERRRAEWVKLRAEFGAENT